MTVITAIVAGVVMGALMFSGVQLFDLSLRVAFWALKVTVKLALRVVTMAALGLVAMGAGTLALISRSTNHREGIA